MAETQSATGAKQSFAPTKRGAFSELQCSPRAHKNMRGVRACNMLKVIPGKTLELLLCLEQDLYKTAHTVEGLVLTYVSLRTFMVWAVCYCTLGR